MKNYFRRATQGVEIQQKKEEIIDIISKSVQKIANRQEVQNFTTAEVKRAMQQSKNKKAGDQDQWKNEMFKEGGYESDRSVFLFVKKRFGQWMKVPKYRKLGIAGDQLRLLAN